MPSASHRDHPLPLLRPGEARTRYLGQVGEGEAGGAKGECRNFVNGGIIKSAKLPKPSPAIRGSGARARLFRAKGDVSGREGEGERQLSEEKGAVRG